MIRHLKQHDGKSHDAFFRFRSCALVCSLGARRPRVNNGKSHVVSTTSPVSFVFLPGTDICKLRSSTRTTKEDSKHFPSLSSSFLAARVTVIYITHRHKFAIRGGRLTLQGRESWPSEILVCTIQSVHDSKNDIFLTYFMREHFGNLHAENVDTFTCVSLRINPQIPRYH